MSDRITITLDKEAYEFLESKANGNRSAYINSILKAEKHQSQTIKSSGYF